MQGFGAWTELVHNQSQCQSIKKPLLDISNFDYAHAPFFKRIKTTLLKKKRRKLEYTETLITKFQYLMLKVSSSS